MRYLAKRYKAGVMRVLLELLLALELRIVICQLTLSALLDLCSEFGPVFIVTALVLDFDLLYRVLVCVLVVVGLWVVDVELVILLILVLVLLNGA